MNRIGLWLAVLYCGLLSNGVEMALEFDRPDARYAAGEEVVFNARITEAGEVLSAGILEMTLTRDGGEVLLQRRFDLSREAPQVTYRMADPGFVWCRVRLLPQNMEHWAAVAFSPQEIRTGREEEPADFDLFWQNGLEEAAGLEWDVRLEPAADLSDDDFAVSRFSMANIGGTRMYGTLSEPRDAGGVLLPAVLTIHGAGPAVDGGMKLPGAITLSMNVHTYRPLAGDTAPEVQEQWIRAEYADWLGEYHHYPFIGARDREQNFYRRAWLGLFRASRWLQTHPRFNRTDFGVVGGSQGGAAVMALAALNPDFTYAVAHVPGMCDHYAARAGRSAGWPGYLAQFPDDRAVDGNIAYFDSAFFARRIRCPMVMTVGFIDYVCPPSTVYAAWNNLASSEKRMVDMVGEGHEATRAFDREVDLMLAYFRETRPAVSAE